VLLLPPGVGCHLPPLCHECVRGHLRRNRAISRCLASCHTTAAGCLGGGSLQCRVRASPSFAAISPRLTPRTYSSLSIPAAPTLSLMMFVLDRRVPFPFGYWPCLLSLPARSSAVLLAPASWPPHLCVRPCLPFALLVSKQGTLYVRVPVLISVHVS
jgi:hypothetical protein